MTSIDPQLFKSGDFELPIIPTSDGFHVHGMTVARQLGFREAYAMVRTLDADEKILVHDGANPQVNPTTNLGVASDLGLSGAAADQMLRTGQASDIQARAPLEVLAHRHCLPSAAAHPARPRRRPRLDDA